MEKVIIGILSFVLICFFTFVITRIITLSVLMTRDKYYQSKKGKRINGYRPNETS